MLRPPPRPPLFPYTTLFRSADERGERAVGHLARDAIDEQRAARGDGDAIRLEAAAHAALRRRARIAANTGGTLLIDGVSDRKSTRLNSSHMSISYAVFCLKK